MAWTKVVTENASGTIAQTAAEAVVLETGRTIATTGEVTVTTGAFDGSGNVTGAATIADNVVDEANLKISNTPTDGLFLQAQSGNTGGMTWATPTDISNLNALTDTTIDGTPADGEVLVYDSTNKWQNQTLAETGIQPLDADLTSLASCQTGGAAALAALTATEIGVIDGLTATTAELNNLDFGVSAIGTAIASKAVVLNATKDYTGIRNFTITGELDAATGDFSGDVDVAGAFSLAGTAVSSTASELNILDGVTATTAELNTLDGVTSTATELNLLDGVSALYTDALNATYWQANAARTIGNSGATLTIAGNLDVTGTTTTVNSTTLSVDDKNINIADGASSLANASGAGLTVNHAIFGTAKPELQWIDTATTVQYLTGWNINDNNDTAHHEIAVMSHSTSDGTGNGAGVGSFHFNTSSDSLWIRTS